MGMGLFALSPLVWQYAITAEVFALNNLFTATLLYLVVRFSHSRSMPIAYMGALVCGLALSNQHSIVLYEIPLILWMLYLLRKSLLSSHGWVILLHLLGFFLLGLTPYSYLPIAASWAPKPGSWGSVDNFAGFLHHLLRRDYGTFQLFSGSKGATAVEGLWERNEAYVHDLSKQGFDDYGAVVMLAVVGLLFSTREVVYSALSEYSVFPANKNQLYQKSATATAALKKNKKSKSKDATKGSPPPHPSIIDSSSTTDTDKSTTVTIGKEMEERVAASRADYIFTPIALIGTQIFYFAVFHSLSNLPLHDRLLFGVHQRFWMVIPIQYLLTLCTVHSTYTSIPFYQTDD